MKLIFLILAFLLSTFCRGQDTTSDKPWTDPIRIWKSYDIPSDRLAQMYNAAEDYWTVYAKGGVIYATDGFERAADTLPFVIKQDVGDRITMGKYRFIQKVDDGFLVVYNHGEWGGRLMWFSRDGKERYVVSHHQIEKFLMRDHKLYAIQGLAHLSMSDGSIIEIIKIYGKWIAKEYVKLPFAPAAAVIDSHNNFIIVTSDNLVKVDQKGRVTTLIEKGFWAVYLYPSSAEIKDDILYVGMQKGVFKYDLMTGHQKWLLPK